MFLLDDSLGKVDKLQCPLNYFALIGSSFLVSINEVQGNFYQSQVMTTYFEHYPKRDKNLVKFRAIIESEYQITTLISV